MERVFDAVYEIDRQYAEKIEHRFPRLALTVCLFDVMKVSTYQVLVTVEGINERKPETARLSRKNIDLTVDILSAN